MNKFSCAVLVFVLAFPCLLAAIQTHPQKIETKRIPKDLGREYESVALSSDGFKLSAWFLPSASSSYPCVLVAHGLNANKDNFLSIAVMLANAGFPVLVFDFRAHGDSGGSQFTIGYREEKDVKAAYDWLKNRFPERAVVGLGYSAGAAAMLRAANKYKIFDRLVLDSTFGRLERVALKSLFRSEGKIARLMWSLGAFWGKVFTGVDFKSFENETAIASLNPESIMLIHGLRDSVIPHTESESLLRATKNRGTIWLIPEADHLQGLGHPMYLQKVGNFLLSDSPSQSVQQ